jgi:hypothetical protein
MLIYFSQHSYYCRRASVTFAAAPFFAPPTAPFGRPPDWGWGQPALFIPPANPPTVRMLSKMVKKPQWSLLWLPATFLIASFSFPHKAVWSLCWPTSWERQIIVKSGVNRYADTSWAWASFMTLLTIILHLDSDPGDGHRRVRFLWSAAAALSSISPFQNVL